DLATADLRTPGFLAAALSVVAFLGVLFVLKESRTGAAVETPRRGRIAVLVQALGRPVLSRLLAIFFLVILAFAGMEATFALGALIAGSLFAALGRNSPFFWGALLVALSLLVAVRLPRPAARPDPVSPPA